MPKSKVFRLKFTATLDEDTFLLYPADGTVNFDRYTQSYHEVPIVKGVVNHLRRWPYDLLLAFLAACLIIASLMLLVFVTAVLCFPGIVTNRCRVATGLELPDAPNAYFLKIENRTWSTREYCYIETAARRHPRLNVYLINVSSHQNPETAINSEFNMSGRRYSESSGTKTEFQLRQLLIAKYTNVRTVDVSVDKLFKGTKLSKIGRHLPGQMLELAAKAQLLWNSPGIVLKPSMYCNLRNIEQQICNKTINDCPDDRQASIDLENDIETTRVPCQAFMGFLIHDIAKNRIDNSYTLETAMQKYCPGEEHCPEIRRLHLNPECSSHDLDCPEVYTSTLI